MTLKQHMCKIYDVINLALHQYGNLNINQHFIYIKTHITLLLYHLIDH